MSSPTIHEIIGPENLSLLVEKFYEKVYADERISHLFTNPIDEVKDKQYRFLTQFLGGPQLYSMEYGHPRMRMRHMPHKVTPKAMEAWLENMEASTKELPIPQEQQEMLYNCFPKLAAHMVNSRD